MDSQPSQPKFSSVFIFSEFVSQTHKIYTCKLLIKLWILSLKKNSITQPVSSFAI